MDILIEPVSGRGFRATANDTFPAIAEAETEEQFLNAVQELLDARASGAAKIVPLATANAATDENEANPWLAIAGIFEDDNDFDEWQAEVAKHRRERDAEDAALSEKTTN